MSGELVTIEQRQQVTPSALLEIAVSKGADVAQLQQLLDLQLRYEANEARKAFVTALTAFKRNPPDIWKTKAVSFGAGKTSYKHATLDNASAQIGAALAQHGISHRWEVEQKEGGVIQVTCILTHELGHAEKVSMHATPDTSGSKNSIQAIGSTTSYLQRYTLFAATGLAAKDEDTDGKVGQELPESAKADFSAAIEELADKAGAEALWKKIAAACQSAGDIPSYEELKSKLSKKVKTLKEQPL